MPRRGFLCGHNFYPRPPRGGRPVQADSLRHPGAISIHALREEGDLSTPASSPEQKHFYPRPPRGGRRYTLSQIRRFDHISIHALREEGDTRSPASGIFRFYFYPRPPRGGRLSGRFALPPASLISIHALREEGDGFVPSSVLTVYLFLSTPSARRATGLLNITAQPSLNFYPRPPRGGRPSVSRASKPGKKISIHALREEGDVSNSVSVVFDPLFLSTPSARRATVSAETMKKVEAFLSTPSARRATLLTLLRVCGEEFLSTPSARRATLCR